MEGDGHLSTDVADAFNDVHDSLKLSLFLLKIEGGVIGGVGGEHNGLLVNGKREINVLRHEGNVGMQHL